MLALFGYTSVIAQDKSDVTSNEEKVTAAEQRELRKQEYIRLQSEKYSAQVSEVEVSKARVEREKRKAAYLKTQLEQKPATINEAERKAIKEERVRRFNSINNSRTEK